MTTVYDKSGKAIELPEDQAQAGLAAGQYGLPKGTRVPVVEGGKLGSVPAENAGTDLSKPGVRLASQAEVQKAADEKQYGGVLGHVAAGVGGALGSASLGITDDLAAALGPEGTKEYLEGAYRTNPGTHLAGQVVGAVAPAAFGDEAGILGALGEAGEAAEGASALGKAGEALGTAGKVLSAPSRAVSGIGRGVEGAFAKALGAEEGGSLISRLAKGAASKGAGFAAEGAAYGMADQVSEDMLGDHELNAEKLYASGVHGALLGLAGGVGLSAAGTLGSELLGRLTPKLGGMAEEQAVRAIEPHAAGARELERLPGGAKTAGRMLLDDGVVRPGDTLEDITPRIKAQKADVGETIGSIYKTADAAGVEGVSVAEVTSRLQRKLTELQKLPHMNRSAIAEIDGALRDIHDYGEGIDPFRAPRDVYGIGLAPNELRAPASKRALGIGEHHEPGLRVSPDDATFAGPGELPSPINIQGMRSEGGQFQRSVGLGGRLEQTGREFPGRPFEVATEHEPFIKPEALMGEPGAIRKPIHIGTDRGLSAETLANARKEYEKGLKLSFQQAQALKTRIGDGINWKNSPFPGIVDQANESRKDIYNVLRDAIGEAGDRAAKELGGSFREELAEANKRYQVYSTLDRIAQNSSRLAEGRNIVSPSTKGIGFASLAGMIAHGAGGPVSLATAAAAAGANHLIKTRGASTAAVLLDKLSALRGVERATSRVDREIDRGIAGILKEPGRAAPTLREAPEGPYRTHAEAALSANKNLKAHGQSLADAAVPLAQHAPNTARAFQSAGVRAARYLAGIVPHRTQVNTLTPHLDEPRVSKADEQTYMLANHAVHDPVSVLDDMAKGRATRAQVDAFRQVYPKMYAEVVQKIRERLADRTDPLPYESRKQLATLGLPAGPEFEPAFQARMQADFAAPPAPSGPGGSAPRGGAPKRMLKTTEDTRSLGD